MEKIDPTQIEPIDGTERMETKTFVKNFLPRTILDYVGTDPMATVIVVHVEKAFLAGFRKGQKKDYIL